MICERCHAPIEKSFMKILKDDSGEYSDMCFRCATEIVEDSAVGHYVRMEMRSTFYEILHDSIED